MEEFDAMDFIVSICSHIRIRTNRWSGIWVTIVMCAGAEGKGLTAGSVKQ